MAVTVWNFLGLLAEGMKVYEKRNGWDPHPKKRAQCSNLCIVTSKRRVTQIYVTICLGFFFPRRFLFLLPQSVLPSGEEARICIWKEWAASRGCFNRLYKYLHSHGLTPWTTYYTISLFLFLSRQGSGADMLLYLCHSSIKRSLHSYDCRVPPQHRSALIWLGIHEASWK